MEKKMIKPGFLIVVGLIFLSLFSCTAKQSFQYQTSNEVKKLLKTNPVYPDAKFIVLSDLHFYDKRLGTTGKAFQEYLDNDRKLLVLSDEIISTAVEKIIKEKPDFILLSGDLTKDGEKTSHQGVIKALKRLESSGANLYVVPGNHDINNSESFQYIGDNTAPVPTINDKEFKSLYHEFGYKEAINEDSQSLSYVIEPVKGLWVLALDSCRWEENKPGHPSITDGAFLEKTQKWIESQLILAKKMKKAVIVLLHHGIMEHYPANEKYYGRYVIDESDSISKLFAAYGVRLVFTGHFHAQDITKKEFKDSDDFIFDIETGSLVTAPCPYRIIEISKGHQATIKSKFIESIPSREDLSDYAYQYVFDGTITMANAKLDKFKVSKEQQPLITSQISKAYCAHLFGDEKKPEVTINKKGFGKWLKFIAWMQKDLINGWWTDLPPKDNNLTINLNTGDVF
jgi:3',5'-cyclic AMP phosphodiesterase CpdA